MTTADGTYQIDIYAMFEALGCDVKVLVECKHFKSPVKRDVVALLYDKLLANGCHKGIIVATSKFESGAIEYEKQHRIALIEIVDGRSEYRVKYMKPGDMQKDLFIPPRPKYTGNMYFFPDNVPYGVYSLQPSYYDGLKELSFSEPVYG